MARKLYGSLNNRLEENRMFCETIEVGTGMTEYFYSDSHAYEVVEVIDQKHVKVREYDHKNIGGAYSNEWELISNPDRPAQLLTKRGNFWYWTTTVTAEDIEAIENAESEAERVQGLIWLCNNNIDKNVVLEKGKVTKYHRANVSFGVAQYYYDYEF